MRYIARNPIDAGLCVDAGQWRWSSQRAYVGRATPPEFLTTERILKLFATNRRRAHEEYDALVHDRVLVA